MTCIETHHPQRNRSYRMMNITRDAQIRDGVGQRAWSDHAIVSKVSSLRRITTKPHLGMLKESTSSFDCVSAGCTTPSAPTAAACATAEHRAFSQLLASAWATEATSSCWLHATAFCSCLTLATPSPAESSSWGGLGHSLHYPSWSKLSNGTTPSM